MIIGYIDAHRDEFGVEPICRVLTEHGCKIAPSTYHASKTRPASARAVRDAAMMQILMVLWVTNRKVYGAHKLWKAARRAGHDIGRDQTARLMRAMDIQGVSRRRKKVFTTIADPDATVIVGDGFDRRDPVDVVVGNPPFVPPERQRDGLRRTLRERYVWLDRRFDLAVPFPFPGAVLVGLAHSLPVVNYFPPEKQL